MATKAFNRLGLRRDRNLSDLPNPTIALNNILNTPTMLGEKSSFTTVDLQPIQLIYVTNISTSTFASLDGVTVQFTVVANGEIQNDSNPIIYKPIIKIKNRLDSAYFSTGEPYFLGGDGPQATYYDANNIIRNPVSWTSGTIYEFNEVILSNNKLYRTSVSASSTTAPSHTSGTVNGFTYLANYDPKVLYLNKSFNPLSGEDTTISDNFWERGRFIYGNKVQNSFLSLFGGVKWEGYFKPIYSGTTTFRVTTTGLTEFSFQASSSPSYSDGYYGNPGNAPWPIAEMNAESADSKYVLIQLQDPVNLKTGDIIYLQSEEGPVKSKQYKVFANNTTGTITSFYINVTRDMNLLGQTPSTFPTADVTSGQGYKCSVRYIPWQNRAVKKYLNSIYHRYTIPGGGYTTSGNTITITDEWIYRNIMINDYIYDYRLYSGDSVRSARRWIVTGLNDNTKTVTVSLDTNYSINSTNNNDQVAYFSGNVVTFIANPNYTQITTTGTTGSISDATISQNLYFVARVGEGVSRRKDIVIDYFLEKYTEYKIDMMYFTKDEDIDPTSINKLWILEERNEVNGNLNWLNYKYLYDKDYVFYKIGDFRNFVDNAVPNGGTSIEDGNDQKTIGKKKLISKGDQYTGLYTLRKLTSNYTPKENWNLVAVTKNASMSNGSRIINISETSDIEVGNYVLESGVGNGTQSGDAFIVPKHIPLGTRVTEVLVNSGAVISKKLTESTGSLPVYFADHKGFITNGVLVKRDGVIPANSGQYFFYGDGSNLEIGKIAVFPESPSESTYIRTTFVKKSEDAAVLTDSAIIAVKNTSTGVSVDVDLNQVAYYDAFTPGVVYEITPRKAMSVIAYCVGAGGGQSGGEGTAVRGGLGGASRGTIALSANSTYRMIIGTGTNSNTGGTPGGGTGVNGGGGGGYTGFFRNNSITQANALLIAGGGGGGGNDPSIGGVGGGTNGERATGGTSTNRGGYGGTQTAGGAAGGAGASAGSALQGGAGGGGGGGGGYYGGGGGRGFETGTNDGGGGGGSGRIDTTRVTSSAFDSLGSSGGGNATVDGGNDGSFKIKLASQVGTTINSAVYEVSFDKTPQYFINNVGTAIRTQVVFYQDRGCNITKPLQYFCTNSACAQNRYNVTTDLVETKYIAIYIGSGDIAGNNVRWSSPSPGTRQLIQNGSAEIALWYDNLTNTTSVDHNKTYKSNMMYAKLAGSEFETNLTGIGHPNFPINEYIPIGFIEGMVRIKGQIWDGTNNNGTTDQEYYFIIRLSNKWTSLTDFDTTAGGLQKGKTIDFTKFPSSSFNIKYCAFPPNQSLMHTNGGTITSLATLTSYFNSYGSYDGTAPYDTTARQPYYFRISGNLTLTSTELNYFYNRTSFAPETGTTYIIPDGSYILFSPYTSGKLVWFSNFEDLQGGFGVYSIKPDNATASFGVPGDIKGKQNLISIHPQNGPASGVIPNPSGSGAAAYTVTGLTNMPYQYLHYRRKQYEITPITDKFQELFPYTRLINPNSNNAQVQKYLDNTTNKLSVYTFSRDLDNKELCCPPLDTSPPFDTSEIGLSTTNSEPDLSIDGLINIRTLSGNHPTNKIHSIPSGQSTTTLPVNKKLKINFGGLSYDLLISDSKPF